ncbi:MAG: hypothetical protein IJS88_06775 [Alphaproteobacteria bacterium]|nr:hypothetical protein [Alphaproteobacteria bacterium]
MIVLYVTCTGVDERTNIGSLVKLMETFQLGEIGIEFSEKQSSVYDERIKWIQELNDYILRNNLFVNAALHISGTWAENMCHGIIVPELQPLLKLRDIYKTPLFKRIKLDFVLKKSDDTDDISNALLKLQYQLHRRFIIRCNADNEQFIEQLLKNGVIFDCLYDKIISDANLSPNNQIYANLLKGYSLEFTPYNVQNLMAQISLMYSRSSLNNSIYIEAQKGLLEYSGKISLDKCYKFLLAFREWYIQYKYQTLGF